MELYNTIRLEGFPAYGRKARSPFVEGVLRDLFIRGLSDEQVREKEHHLYNSKGRW